MNKIAWILAVLLLVASPIAAQTVGGCPALPPNNVWNAAIDTLPLDPNSVTLVNTIGAAKGLHADFSATGYGIPYTTVDASQPKVKVTFNYAAESDPGPYPIPANAPIEGGSASTGDRHVLVVDAANCVLYELYAAYPQADGSWTAGSGAVFDLNSNILRPAGWTSSDAAGLPVLPGLVRYDEVAAGEIRHALRITVPQTRNTYVWPATHKASTLTGTQYPQMGQRLRLKAGFDVTPFGPDVQVILRALKKYGAIVADNGSSWYLTGAPDSRWNDTTLHELGQVLGSNMEVVDESSLMVDPNSGVVRGSALALDGVYLPLREVAAGASVTAKVILTASAPSGGVTVYLTASDPAMATMPAQAAVPQGGVSAAFTIATPPSAPSGDLIVYASDGAATRNSLPLRVDGAAAPAPAPAPATLATLSLSPSSVVGGQAGTGTVTLTAAAPPGGAVVALASGNASLLAVPPSVAVPAGAASASFAFTTSGVKRTTKVTVTASYGGITKNAALTVTRR